MSAFDLKPRHRTAFTFVVLLLSAACSTPSIEADLEPAKISAEPDATWPMCGVVNASGMNDELIFVVPNTLQGETVRRYDLLDATTLTRPMSASDGWWVCITEGRVLEEPDPEQPRVLYGKIEALSYTYDQRSEEAGME